MEKEKKSKDRKFNSRKRNNFLIICIAIVIFSILNAKQIYLQDYSIAIKAAMAGDNQKAEIYFQRAINATLGLNPDPMLELGKLYSYEGKYSKAEPLIKKALDISRKKYQSNDVRLVNAIYALGTLYSREGKYQDAELLFNEALKSVGGGNVKLKADILESLGSVYQNLKDYKKAESIYLQSIDLKKKFYDEKQLYIEGAYTDLGILYLDTGSYNKAEQIFKHSLDLCKINICKDSQKVNIYMNLSSLYSHLKDFSKAEEYIEKAMNLYNGKVYHKDIITVKILCGLSGISLLNDKNKALEQLNEALKIAIQNTGENSNLSKFIKANITTIKNMEVEP